MKTLSEQEISQLIRDLMSREQWADLENLARQCLKGQDHAPFLVIALARALEKTKRVGEAVAVYDDAIVRFPSHGLLFTHRARLLLQQYWGPPPVPRAGATGSRVTSSQLGSNGRFGNQLLQYATTKLYASTFGLDAEFPYWIGRDLFDLDDPLISKRLPPAQESKIDILDALNNDAAASLANRDLQGYFIRHSADFRQFRGAFTALFRPGRKLAEKARDWDSRVAGQTLVALHLRRGDFGSDAYWIAPEQWYLTWLEDIWPRLSSPRLFIATDDPRTLDAFSTYNPMTSLDFGDPIPGAEFYVDFHLLTQAHVLGISNSTFSFLAAMLNTRGETFVRPEKIAREMIAFDPWNAPIALRYEGSQ